MGYAGLFSRLFSLTKAFYYTIRYGKKFRFVGFPSFRKGAIVKLHGGSMKVGRGFRANSYVYCAVLNDGSLSIGNGVSMNRNCMVVCHKSIKVGDNVLVGPNCVIYDHDHLFDASGVKSGYETSSVVIEDNCWIGANVSILKGSHISEGSVIGAGTVVRGFVPPHSVVTSDSRLRIRPIGEV